MEMIKNPFHWMGLSTDTKPSSNVPVGSTFFEIDSREEYTCFDGSQWVFKSAEDPHLDIKTTEDLNQAAASYDLFTATTQAIIVHHLYVYIPVDVSASEDLTSISVVSTDTSPVTFINTTAGDVANLTAGKLLEYDGADVVASTKKIQLVIAGGAAGVACPAIIWVSYTPTSNADGYLVVA